MVSLALPNLIRSFFWLCNCAFSIFLTTPLSSGKLVMAKREAFNPQIAHKNNAILIHIVLCDILYCIWLAELSIFFMYSTEFQGIPQKSTTFHRMSGKAIVFRWKINFGGEWDFQLSGLVLSIFFCICLSFFYGNSMEAYFNG